ncbi:MAG: efflux RND transporter periplasmic adaptor subunit [candidate division Zixibacteria bacterium]|nr:efflux RND transporter periplasmic adaptor subunit [candidate division Zixibacteria bacterium]
MNRTRVVLTALLLVSIIYSFAEAQQIPPTLVVTEPVKKMEFHDQITLVGRTEGISHSRVVALVNGKVLRIDAEEGQPIRKGDALLSIDCSKIELNFRAKKAEAAEAAAKSELARKNLDRAEKLFSEETISQSKIDSERATEIADRENRNRLDAERDAINIDVFNCVVSSPYDGYTVKKLVDIGEWVSPGTPVYEVVNLSEIRVTVDLPERYFGRLKIGSEVLIHTSKNESNPLNGVIIGIAPSASEKTHTFPVIVSFDNENEELGSGMLVKATLFLNESFISLAVSKDAIIRQGSQTLVYSISEGKANPVYVQVGSTNGEMIAIQSEKLLEGTLVVTRGNERIFPGSPVRTAEGGPPGGPGAIGAPMGIDGHRKEAPDQPGADSTDRNKDDKKDGKSEKGDK